MRTISGGVRAFRRAPLAVAPHAVEGMVAAFLVGSGAWPARSASGSAAGVFPVGLYFDLKNGLGASSSWIVFGVVLAGAVTLRSAVLAGTVWLADERTGTFTKVWLRAGRLTIGALIALVPGAAMFFAATAGRYAPFAWAAAALTFAPALLLTRRAVRLDGGRGPRAVSGIPGSGDLLVYGYALAILGVILALTARASEYASALVLVAAGPCHALVLLGWRERSDGGGTRRAGRVALAVTGAALVSLFAFAFYTRNVLRPAAADPAGSGTLLLLGGADSTSTTGALAGLDPRALGWQPQNTETASYRGPGKSYVAADTHSDLDIIARRVALQVEQAPPPQVVLGHSQAALILDRLLVTGLPAPERSVEVSAPPPVPTPVRFPAPGRSGPGRPGADLTRGVLAVFGEVGLPSYDIDAPAYPARLSEVVASRPTVARLSVWALGDSVWLDGDWRRPHETNIISLSDHVGAVRDPYVLEAAGRFLAGRSVRGEEASWKGALVSTISYLFAPWRP